MSERAFAEDCIKRNADYAASSDLGALPAAPGRKAAIVACMDARMETGRLLGLVEGEAHVIRNAGGVVTDDVLRSLVISQRLLGTTEIILVQHTGCGMLTFRDDDLKDAIEAETGLRPAFAMEAFADLRASVRQSMRRIRACPFLPLKDQVSGFILDLETGRLEAVPFDGQEPAP